LDIIFLGLLAGSLKQYFSMK